MQRRNEEYKSEDSVEEDYDEYSFGNQNSKMALFLKNYKFGPLVDSKQDKKYPSGRNEIFLDKQTQE